MVRQTVSTAPDIRSFASPAEMGDLGITTSPFISQQAIVVDVITNEEHPDYSRSGDNVGRATIVFTSQQSDPIPHYAWPQHSSIQEIPLVGEIINVTRMFNSFFYDTQINAAHGIKWGFQDFEMLEAIRNNYDEATRDSVAQVIAGGLTTPTQAEELAFSKDQIRRIHGLKFLPGDFIVQNKTGASIRLTSNLAEKGLNQETETRQIPQELGGGSKTVFLSQNKRGDTPPLPSIVIRTYEPPSTATTTVSDRFARGLTMESINDDASSIYMHTDIFQKFQLSTFEYDVHARSVLGWDKTEIVVDGEPHFDGAQILINSNRIVLNAQKERVVMSSKGGINMMTAGDITLDTNKDLISYIGRDLGLTVNQDLILSVGNDFSFTTQQDWKLQSGNQINFTSGENMIFQSGQKAMIRAGDDVILSGARVFLGDHNQIDSDKFEGIALGESLSQFLANLIMIFIVNAPIIGTMGVAPVQLSPKALGELTALYTNLTVGPKFVSKLVRGQRVV
ncbi:MAG: hypothetical protein VW683_00315 [Betaproteobacteria bacterium]|jgi:hypothetical protein